MPDVAPAPDPNADLEATYRQLLQQTVAPPPVALPQGPTASSHEGRGFLSLLGEALGGGQEYGTTPEREAGGLAALGAMGRSMLQGSDYSYQRHSLGSIIGGGMGAAGEALGQRQAVSAAQQAANLDYQKQQQDLQLARIKEAVPILTQLQTLQQQKRVAGMPSSLGGTPTTIGAAGTGGIGAVGSDTGPINAAGDSATRKAAEGGPPAPGTPAAAVAQQVHDFWISKGYSESQVAGILAGGPGSESNFDPTASGDKGTSIGLYQHHGERIDGMRKFFNLSGSQMPSADQQNQYAYWEITQGPLKNVGEMLKKAQSPAEAAAIWTQYFGVPKDKTEIGRRALGAGRFAGLYTPQQPPGSTATVAADGKPVGDPTKPELAPGPPGSTVSGPPVSLGSAIGAIDAGKPQYTVAPPPSGKGTPLPAGHLATSEIDPTAVSGNVEAIQAGRQRALASMQQPDGSVLAAGPAAPTGGFTSGAGSYATTTTPPPVPTPQPTTQATTQPQTPPAGDTTPPAAPPTDQGPPTFTYTRHDPPPGMLQGSKLTPEEQSVVADARNAYQNAIRVAITPEQRQQAEATLQATLDKELTARAGRTDAAGKQMADWYANDFKQQQEAHKQAVDAFYKNREQQQTFDQQSRLKEIEGQQTRLTNKEAVFNQANQKGLEAAQTEQLAARNSVAQLEGFRSVSDAVKQPNWLQTTKWPGSNHSIAEQLQQSGIPVEDTAGVQLLQGAMTNLTRTLREGMPMGALSDRDLDFIQRMGPTEWMDQDTRTAAVDYLQRAFRAKQRFASDVQKEMSRGKNYGDAVDTADAKQPKSFVPTVDAELSSHWADNSKEWVDRRVKWAQDNDVRPGTLFHMNNGNIVIWKRKQPSQGQ